MLSPDAVEQRSHRKAQDSVDSGQKQLPIFSNHNNVSLTSQGDSFSNISTLEQERKKI